MLGQFATLRAGHWKGRGRGTRYSGCGM